MLWFCPILLSSGSALWVGHRVWRLRAHAAEGPKPIYMYVCFSTTTKQEPKTKVGSPIGKGEKLKTANPFFPRRHDTHLRTDDPSCRLATSAGSDRGSWSRRRQTSRSHNNKLPKWRRHDGDGGVVWWPRLMWSPYLTESVSAATIVNSDLWSDHTSARRQSFRFSDQFNLIIYSFVLHSISNFYSSTHVTVFVLI
jgi:hypothetical protein